MFSGEQMSLIHSKFGGGGEKEKKGLVSLSATRMLISHPESIPAEDHFSLKMTFADVF